MDPGDKVMLIDQDRTQLATLSAWLRQGGFVVVTLDGPIGMLQTFARERPSLVLISAHMPAGAGPLLASMLAREATDTSVVIVLYTDQDPSKIFLPAAPAIAGVIRTTGSGDLFLAEIRKMVDNRAKGPAEARRRVLVVDDDPLQLQVVRAWLESDRFDVFPYSSPIGVTTVIRQEQLSIALIDVDMPVVNGPTLAEIIATHVKHPIDIIFYSGKDQTRLDQLVKENQGLVRGAIRKTTDGKKFLADFRRLVQMEQAPQG